MNRAARLLRWIDRSEPTHATLVARPFSVLRFEIEVFWAGWLIGTVLRLFGMGAITWGHIWFRRDRELTEELLDHEAAHARQQIELGLWRFSRRYLGEYLIGRLGGLSHREAYRAISYEMEARDEK